MGLFFKNDFGESLCSKLGVVGFRGPLSGVRERRTLVFRGLYWASPFMESSKLIWDVGRGADFSHRLMLQFRVQGGLGPGFWVAGLAASGVRSRGLTFRSLGVGVCRSDMKCWHLVAGFQRPSTGGLGFWFRVAPKNEGLSSESL